MFSLCSWSTSCTEINEEKLFSVIRGKCWQHFCRAFFAYSAEDSPIRLVFRLFGEVSPIRRPNRLIGHTKMAPLNRLQEKTAFANIDIVFAYSASGFSE